MTTVGYGDLTPKTPEGKGIAISVMLIGIGFAALVVGAIAERFISPTKHEADPIEPDLVAQVRDISEQVRDTSARLQRLERALAERLSAGLPSKSDFP